jgi:hypothetical protein
MFKNRDAPQRSSGRIPVFVKDDEAPDSVSFSFSKSLSFVRALRRVRAEKNYDKEERERDRVWKNDRPRQKDDASKRECAFAQRTKKPTR